MTLLLFFGLLELIFILTGFSFQPMTHCGSFGDHFEAGDSYYLRDPRRFWVPIPNSTIQAEWVGKDGAKISSYSTRGSEPEIPKPDDVFRVLVMGDSGTFGFGVNDNETWPAYLEECLNTSVQKFAPEGQNSSQSITRRIEVINAGVNGYSTHQAVEHYKILEPIMDPDLVIMSTGRNDIVALQMADRDRPVVSPVMLKLAEWSQYTRLGQFILYLSQKEQMTRLVTLPENDADKTLRVSEEQFNELVDFMIADNASKDRQFIFLMRGGHWAQLRKFKDRRNFTVIDLKPLDQLGQIMLFLEGGHPDKEALHLVAEYVCEVINMTNSE